MLVPTSIYKNFPAPNPTVEEASVVTHTIQTRK